MPERPPLAIAPKSATLGGMRKRRGSDTETNAESPQVELVPASAAEDGGRLLTRAEAARVLGISETTLRRREAEGLRPIVRGGVHMFEETVIRQAVTTHTHRRRWSEEPASDGGIAADVFSLLAEGVAPRDIVIRLRIPPEVVSRLCEHWARLGDGFFVSAEEANSLNVSSVGAIRALVTAALQSSPECEICGTRPSSVCFPCNSERTKDLRRALYNIPVRPKELRVERRANSEGREEVRLVLIGCEVQNLAKHAHEPGRRTRGEPTLRTEWELASASEWASLFATDAVGAINIIG